jgi:hypothetical protein
VMVIDFTSLCLLLDSSTKLASVLANHLPTKSLILDVTGRC